MQLEMIFVAGRDPVIFRVPLHNRAVSGFVDGLRLVRKLRAVKIFVLTQRWRHRCDDEERCET
jgi:hypothetical protein